MLIRDQAAGSIGRPRDLLVAIGSLSLFTMTGLPVTKRLVGGAGNEAPSAKLGVRTVHLRLGVMGRDAVDDDAELEEEAKVGNVSSITASPSSATRSGKQLGSVHDVS